MIDGYPYYSTNYKEQWLTQADGSFPSNTWLVRSDWNLMLSFGTNYVAANIDNRIVDPAAGDVIDLGEIMLHPVDDDANGIADFWETQNEVTDPDADPDKDGMDNRSEYLAGTDPHDGASCFKVDAVRRETQGHVVEWTPMEGRTYEVWWTPSLDRGFQLLESDLAYPVGSYTDAVHTASASGYYKVVLRYPTKDDSDGDGLPNIWEGLYFASPVSAIARYDADGDGQTNAEEFVAGTDPTNATSYHRVESIRHDSAGTVIEWSPASNRVYSVLWADRPGGTFKVLATDIEYPQNSWTDTVDHAVSSGCYKLDVKIKEGE
ncbi:hypothetical protein PDESU_00431 [Pontiella desulfatans]|uniref:Uncharacterized protein n=1 Tax=Pontiella desulfatans TaxID=2750659 RepID=A0A6C2TWA9_PONDE|nr:thrombospondin type 3 repeat-containing protein [Pontiella desulfatans]VGO11883.1 hypothetical protein PDESU_00431 [Pontiella desulfatans]